MCTENNIKIALNFESGKNLQIQWRARYTATGKGDDGLMLRRVSRATSPKAIAISAYMRESYAAKPPIAKE